jgi:hypothetical protein
MTTTVVLDASNHLTSLKYTVTAKGQTVGSLAISKIGGRSTPPGTSMTLLSLIKCLAPSYFVPPSTCTDSDDPFNPASCNGPLLDLPSKFLPGAKVAALANYTLAYQSRACTQFTGCGAWAKTTPSWGPSGKGTIWLKVTSTGIIAALVDHSAGSVYGKFLWSCLGFLYIF